EAGGRAEASVPHLVGEAVALEDVPAGETGTGLDVGRAQDLAMLDHVDDVGGEAGDRGEDLVTDLVAPRVPVAPGQVVGRVLGEDAHRVASGRRHTWVVGALEV